MIENEKLSVSVTPEGYVSELFIKGDKYKMNWVIDKKYLDGERYEDAEKLFGHFDIIADGEKLSSNAVLPKVTEKAKEAVVKFDFAKVSVEFIYDLSGKDLCWKIRLHNKTDEKINISEFGVWISFAYVMFKDKNVLKNIHNSAAVFPSISRNYTKISIVRRDGEGENLGMYQTKGECLSVGTYCEYRNLFFENVSPSLDGMLFHKLYFAGGYEKDFKNNDWIYGKDGFELNAAEEREWEFVINTNKNKREFYNNGLKLRHSKIKYTPLNIIGEMVRGRIEVPERAQIISIDALYKEKNTIKKLKLAVEDTAKKNVYNFNFKPAAMGEHKIVISFSDGTEDSVVLNVMDNLEKVIEERVDYICNSLYNGENGRVPYAFEPVSNQGESLGKANLVLKKNLIGKLDKEQVRKVEKSAVYYVREKWFENGDFKKPVKLYGDFYRCMDFEYIGHLFFLLSEFDDSVLELNTADTYLNWAAEIFDLRINPKLHDNERGKEEAQMLGVYFLYFNKLLKRLQEKGLIKEYEKINSLWKKVIERIDSEADTYKAAITEHYYDNAGFGPTAGALAESGKKESAGKYGKLLLANIGYSNDFRAQNPDRWWEALTYMIHSLWGGVTAAAAFKVFRNLHEVEYLDASYRATAGILYCYDTHATAASKLEKGMAASTYAVAGPHLNRPDLSRDRFGQSVFYRDGGIFAKLFDNDSQTPDWDMGEELVAYLENFGDKTFIIKDDKSGEIEVLNGSFEETDEEYVITGFAPYSNKFYYISHNDIILLNSEKNRKTITVKKEK